jgi:hypothetical protein
MTVHEALRDLIVDTAVASYAPGMVGPPCLVKAAVLRGRRAAVDAACLAQACDYDGALSCLGYVPCWMRHGPWYTARQALLDRVETVDPESCISTLPPPPP